MADKLKLTESERLYQEALGLIPGATLGIRRPYNFVIGEYPVFFTEAKGGRVLDVDGNDYIDMLCAYGPIIIGHREKEIDDAVIDQIRNKGFCMSLTQSVQNELAKKLRQLVPSCEKAVFVKTGSDGTTAAVRIARGFTERNKLLRCGYHGWHDWCVEVKGGVPQKVSEDVFEFSYNDLDEVEDLLKKHGDDVAAIMMTPLGHPLAKPVCRPKEGFLEGVRALADHYGVVLIYDEVRTGFRVNLGGVQKVYNVTPDISVLGKAMANGYPVGAVVGKKDIMDVLESKVFLSSTFFPNSDAQVAALKTIEIMERDSILERIRDKGERFGKLVAKAIKDSGIDCTFSGAPWMPYITFNQDPDKRYKALRTEFYTQLIRRRVFLQPYHHGYIAYRHTDEDLDYAAQAIAESLDELKKLP